MNLLNETIEKLKEHEKTPDDVLWVGNHTTYTTWEDYERVANIDYDDGFGGNEIADSLLVVGKDFWLERGEYDGSEWWNYKEYPIKPTQKKKLKSVENIDYEEEITFYD